MRGIVFLLFINEAILRAKKTFRVCRGWSSGPPGTFLRLEVDKSDNISMVGHLCSEHDGGRQKHDEIKRLGGDLTFLLHATISLELFLWALCAILFK